MGFRSHQDDRSGEESDQARGIQAFGAFEPYGVIGAGWYYTRVDIDTPLVQDGLVVESLSAYLSNQGPENRTRGLYQIEQGAEST